MNLFQLGSFTLHSGERSGFKIDCDALTDADLKCVAALLVQRLPPFSDVIGVAHGGVRLAMMLSAYGTQSGSLLLLADDVLTTGASMDACRRIWGRRYSFNRIIGAVIFARGPCPEWITPLFKMLPKNTHD